jgi:bacterioferritin-associated ferredoxin
MYVCLCVGVSSKTVADAVAAGATTSNQVAAACGAGTECGRCRRTVRAIIDSRRGGAASPPVRDVPDPR